VDALLHANDGVAERTLVNAQREGGLKVVAAVAATGTVLFDLSGSLGRRATPANGPLQRIERLATRAAEQGWLSERRQFGTTEIADGRQPEIGAQRQ
jgi:hypothetical protein